MSGNGERAGGDEGAERTGETLPTTWIAQAGRDRVRVMTGLSVFVGSPYLCGPALTCVCAPEDNLAMHAAIYHAAPGTVIVCHGGGTIRAALVGEFMATEAASRGLAGIVVQGPVRDAGDLDRLGFPVLCTGTAPGQAAKSTVVSVGRPVLVGGVTVAPGDQVIADRDGAVVVPAGDWPAVRADAAGLAGREAEIRRRMAAGERLPDITGLDLSAYRPPS